MLYKYPYVCKQATVGEFIEDIILFWGKGAIAFIDSIVISCDIQFKNNSCQLSMCHKRTVDSNAEAIRPSGS